jgi:hypothetical protein
MNDLQLLTFGCAITFLAAAGGYVAIREQFIHGLFERRATRRASERRRHVAAAEEAARP